MTPYMFTEVIPFYRPKPICGSHDSQLCNNSEVSVFVSISVHIESNHITMTFLQYLYII